MLGEKSDQKVPLGETTCMIFIRRICILKVAIFVKNSVREALGATRGPFWEAFGSALGSQEAAQLTPVALQRRFRENIPPKSQKQLQVAATQLGVCEKKKKKEDRMPKANAQNS